MKLQANTIWTNAIITEALEMQDMVTEGEITNMYDGEGGIAIPVSAQPLSPKYKTSSVLTMGQLTNKIIHDCLSMEVPLLEAMKLVSQVVLEDAQATVYGAIWVNKANPNIRLNLLHPVIAYSVLNSLFNSKLDDEGTLYIYEWHSSVAGLGMLEDYHEDYVGIWENVITTVSSMYQPKVSHRCATDMRNVTKAIREGKSLEDVTVQFTPRGNNPEKVLTPVHLYTEGMLFPYYGVVHSEVRSQGSAYVSRDLTIMGSCNVNHDGSKISNWGGTCTGSASNTVYVSLRNLCNANTGSAHHTDVLYGDYRELKTFVKLTQEYACVFIDDFIANNTPKDETDGNTNEDNRE